MARDEIDDYIDALGITEEGAAEQREEASVGCQHANMQTDGISTWCPDCPMADFS
jgi:hypothetical protein